MTKKAERREYAGYHVVWCTNHGVDCPGHSTEEPYCSDQIAGIDLTPQGDVVRHSMWVMATASYTDGEFTPAEVAQREQLYNGVELSLQQWRGPDLGWDEEQKLRLTSDKARSLAAALIRAADIQQGLTR